MPFNQFKSRILAGFDIRKLSGKFETVKQMKAERDVRIAALEKAKGSDHLSLADVLKKCAKGDRCLNAACPTCTRRYRVWVVGETLRLVGYEMGLVMVTLVNVNDAFLRENLRRFNPSRAINRFRQQLRRGGVEGWIVGGLDGEYDEDRQLYQPHFHLICLASQVAKIQQMAARHYPGGGEIYRGCVIKPVEENLAETVTYTLKGYWPKKVRFEGNRRRSAKRLDCKLHSEWLLWRSQFRLVEFSIFYRLRRYGGELAVIDKN